jgi:hypothetical protein
MAFIGNTVQTQGFTPAIDYFNGNGVTVTFTLSRPVASVAQMIVAIDNVIQNPSSAFNVSGNSITFTSAPLSGTNNIWVEYTSLITTYQGISQDPSVIGDITATGGFLSTGDFGNSFIDGAVIDYVTGAGRITVGELDNLIFYHGGTSGRSEMMKLSYAGASTLEGGLTATGAGSFQGVYVGKGTGSVATNTAIGASALTGSNSGTGENVAIGYEALKVNSTGNRNTAVGLYSAGANTTGNNNVAIGNSAFQANTTGGNNVAIGNQALQSNTTGSSSTAVGYQALYSSTTNGGNTAFGNQAGFKATGSGNVFIGNSAGYWQTTSSYNTVCGDSAGGLSGTALTGNHNTSIGNSAGQSLQGVGAYNTFVGSGAGIGATAAQSAIIIGYGADVSSNSTSNEINIAINTTGAGSNYVSFGKAGNLVYNQFTVNSSWTRSSDARLKKDIQDDNLGLDFICKVQPRTFKWKPSNEVPQELHRHYSEENNMDLEATMNGFIAQEVKQALDDVGATVQGVWSTELDGTQAVSREMFIMPLINAIKEQQALITSLTARIAALEAK